MAGRGLTKCLYVYRLSDFDAPLTKIRGSDNIFVAAVSPEELLQSRQCEVSLWHVYICLHLKKKKIEELFRRSIEEKKNEELFRRSIEGWILQDRL